MSRLRSRAAWVFADSALSSLTNAGLTIGLARVVSSEQYGAFALAFTLFSLVQSVSVALNNQVVVIRYADGEADVQHRAGRAASAGSVSVGLLSGAVLVVIGLVSGQSVGPALLAMGAMLPALMLQDHWRSTFIAYGEPRRAFLLDLVWGVLWASGFAVLIGAGVRDAWAYVLVWGVGALLSAAYGMTLARTTLTLRGAVSWLRSHRDISMPSLANTLATIGAAQVAFLLISTVGSIQDLGALRGVQTLLGPLNIVGYAIVSFATPELVRRGPPRRVLLLTAGLMGVGMVAVIAAWGGVLLLLPDVAGRELLGDTWTEARSALPGLVLYQAAIGSVIGVSVVLRALDRVRWVFFLSAMLGPLIIVCSVAGVLLGGASGAAYGFAVAGALVVAPSVVAVLRGSRMGRREIGSQSGGAEGSERSATSIEQNT